MRFPSRSIGALFLVATLGLGPAGAWSDPAPAARAAAVPDSRVVLVQGPDGWITVEVGLRGELLGVDSIPLVYRGEERLRVENQGGLVTVNGATVAIDGRWTTPEALKALLRAHPGEVPALLLDGTNTIDSGVMEALARTRGRELVVSLRQFRGGPRQLDRLAPLKDRLTGLLLDRIRLDVSVLRLLASFPRLTMLSLQGVKADLPMMNALCGIRTLEVVKLPSMEPVSRRREDAWNWCPATWPRIRSIAGARDMEAYYRLHVPIRRFVDLTEKSWREELVSSLRHLSIRACNVIDASLAQMAMLLKLETLSVRPWAVTRKGIAQIGRIHTLRALTLLHLSESLPASAYQPLTNLTDLRYLHLEHLPIPDGAMAHLGRFSRLQALILGAPRVSPEALRPLAKLADLRALDLAAHRLGSAHAAVIGAAPHLELLALRGAPADDAWLRALSPLPKLRSLRVTFASTSAPVTDAGLEALGRLTSLEALFLGGPGTMATKITGAGFAHLAKLTRLRALALPLARLGDADLAPLARLGELRSLALQSHGLTDRGLDSVVNLKNLRDLGLSDARITDAGLQRLASLRHLRSVTLERTRVTRDGARRLERALPACRVYLR